MINLLKNMNEFELIKHYFDWGFGVGDDCAVVEVSPKKQLLATVDTLIEGVHFPENTAPKDIAHKALTVNLSDLAAMGGTPKYFTLSLTLPYLNEAWLCEFSNALKTISQQYKIKLLGGDTTKGTLSITINAVGEVGLNQALLRSNAQVGDLIFVSNTLGDAAFAWQKIQNKHTPESFLLQAFNTPNPQIDLGQSLIGIANSCIDISDGLLQDLGHILTNSSVGAEIYLNKIPLSGLLKKHIQTTHEWCLPLSGGDDYQLCFTLPPENLTKLKKTKFYTQLTQIGLITADTKLRLVDGEKWVQQCASYQHF
jgi:thiamine-monophosphate kinase